MAMDAARVVRNARDRGVETMTDFFFPLEKKSGLYILSGKRFKILRNYMFSTNRCRESPNE